MEKLKLRRFGNNKLLKCPPKKKPILEQGSKRRRFGWLKEFLLNLGILSYLPRMPLWVSYPLPLVRLSLSLSLSRVFKVMFLPLFVLGKEGKDNALSQSLFFLFFFLRFTCGAL
jgi:hypothetical protein